MVRPWIAAPRLRAGTSSHFSPFRLQCPQVTASWYSNNVDFRPGCRPTIYFPCKVQSTLARPIVHPTISRQYRVQVRCSTHQRRRASSLRYNKTLSVRQLNPSLGSTIFLCSAILKASCSTKILFYLQWVLELLPSIAHNG